MSFDWTEYYHVARLLLDRAGSAPNDEAKQRSAISRSYYAVFNLALEYIKAVEGEDTIPDNRDVHYTVRDYFLRRRDKVSQDIGDHLNWMRKERNRADYRGDMRDVEKTANACLSRANLVMQLLGKLKR